MFYHTFYYKILIIMLLNQTNFNIMKSINIHIGEIILSVMTNKGVTKAEMARLLEVKPQSIDYLLKRKSIDTDTLYNICEVLKYDFWAHFKNKEKQTYLDRESEYLKVNEPQVLYGDYKTLVESLKMNVKLLTEKLKKYENE